MSWGKRTISGVEYDLTHLDSFLIDVTPAARGAPTYKVLVSFGCHCFARDVLPTDPVEHHIQDGEKTRCFCPTRTAHSQHLPRIVQNAPAGLVYFSQGKNMLLVKRLPGLNGPYAIFFNVRQSSQKNVSAVMFVASAYEKPGLVSAMPALPFVALIATASNGQKPFKPQRLTRW